MVHDVPNASKRTSRTGERDDKLVASVLVDNMVLGDVEVNSPRGKSAMSWM
jgi:hypothetical protein